MQGVCQSTGSAVHRPLVVAHPPLAGADVRALQEAIHDTGVLTPRHGRFTLATALAGIEAQYRIGLLPETYQRRDLHGNRLITEQGQLALRTPRDRSADQLERTRERRGQLELDGDFYAKLRQELGLSGNGVEAALMCAESQVGMRERPAGSNAGPWISAWSRAAGYRDPVPWAGCFVNVCLMAGGLDSGAGWIGYAPELQARAAAGVGGWTWHGDGARGDLALFVDGGAPDLAVHVEIVRERLGDAVYSTVGGNTSLDPDKHVDGGAVVRHDDRSTGGALPIVGFARPPW